MIKVALFMKLFKLKFSKKYNYKSFTKNIYLLFNLGRPFSEILFFKGAQETRKQGRLLYVNQKHRDKPIAPYNQYFMGNL